MGIEEQLDVQIKLVKQSEAAAAASGLTFRYSDIVWLQHAVDAAKYQGGSPS